MGRMAAHWEKAKTVERIPTRGSWFGSCPNLLSLSSLLGRCVVLPNFSGKDETLKCFQLALAIHSIGQMRVLTVSGIFHRSIISDRNFCCFCLKSIAFYPQNSNLCSRRMRATYCWLWTASIFILCFLIEHQKVGIECTLYSHFSTTDHGSW